MARPPGRTGRGRHGSPASGSSRSPRRARTGATARGTGAGSAAARTRTRKGPGGSAAEASRPDAPERIAKALARAGAGSRRDIERLIAAGRVAIAGTPVATPATRITTLEGLTIDGRPVAAAEPTRLFLFHKPAGFLTAARDPAGRPTIYDILPPGVPRLMPVGRLDLMTEGLLLLTNDGALKRRLELPANAVERVYRVRVLGAVREADLERLALGLEVEGVRYGPVHAEIDRRAARDSANIWLTMRLAEGKNREVRRLCEALGLRVSRLIRTAFGPFALEGLAPRALVEVPGSELARLLPRPARSPRPPQPGA